ncbi:MAG: triose-phosphate isomerase [Candidatus Nomurabacteria bacterium]|nr:triose-phosphate isomerase [Candidatus Saccharibacteria bacterium]USN95283.1 MAG: triose-phosphate isomerase [Candidatus Nomurabacteria bacterium]
MSRRKLIVGNWKMHLNTAQASLLAHRLHERIRIYRNLEVVLAPNVLVLQPLSLQIDRRKFRLCAQNAYYKDEGAYTGEVSFTMLRDLVHYAIIGHSERRQYFNESDAIVRDKVSACVRNEITPILCVGETKTQRRAGETQRVLHDQVATAVSGLTAHEVGNMVIAYEPVWAISTFGGELAKPTQVKEAMDGIRNQINNLYGKRASQNVRVLYGGSVDDQIARGYLEITGCDGVLVGGASINYHKFSGIVESAYKMQHERGEDV